MTRKTMIWNILAATVVFCLCFAGYVLADTTFSGGSDGIAVRMWKEMRGDKVCMINGVRNLASAKGLSCYFKKFIPDMENFAGMPMFVPKPNPDGMKLAPEDDFRHYNKDFVVWLRKNFVPAAKNPVFRRATQFNYDVNLREDVRKYYESHEWLVSNPDYKLLLADLKGQNKPLVAHKRLSSLLDWRPEGKFWVRRTIDGTEAELFKGVLLLLETYDTSYLEVSRKSRAFYAKYPEYLDIDENRHLFSGKIDGKYDIRMKLGINGSDLTGVYYYTSVGKEIPVRGTVDREGLVRIKEFGKPGGKYSGTFEGIWDGRIMKGLWSDGKNKQFEFSFEHYRPWRGSYAEEPSSELKFDMWYRKWRKEGDMQEGESYIAGITLKGGDKVEIGRQYYDEKGPEGDNMYYGVMDSKAYLLHGNPDIIFVTWNSISGGNGSHTVYGHKVFVKGSPDMILFWRCSASGHAGWSDIWNDGYYVTYEDGMLKVVYSDFTLNGTFIEEDGALKGRRMTETHRRVYLTYKIVDSKALELVKAFSISESRNYIQYDDYDAPWVNEPERFDFEAAELPLEKARREYIAVTPCDL
ncbi:MAG: hypothetical protein OEV59_07650 [Deltaproteobacteria bacterium]|nr:hypothetical protein [Deltaproteobacteria bacterium]